MSAPATDPRLHTFSHYPAIPAPAVVRRGLRVLAAHPCNYLPDRMARSVAFYAADMPVRIYEDCMDAGFRRSGRLVYQPTCTGCRECVPIRVPVDQFKPSKSQRRCWNRNHDLQVTVQDAAPDDEAFDLYLRYLHDWHADHSQDHRDRDSFESFLYDSPVPTCEFRYRVPGGKLVAVGLCDLGEKSISSVYFFFDPSQSRRGLGTLGALRELQFARERGLAYYYLGYWIRDCRAMTYKSSFRPFQVLDGDGVWRRADDQFDGRAHHHESSEPSAGH